MLDAKEQEWMAVPSIGNTGLYQSSGVDHLYVWLYYPCTGLVLGKLSF